ncbi:hypothetical protein E2C01_079781 [Portunus trituberculatus]|uniref:Uncharacterized protein n=1 Tax=Portunus trituberculatus TaxID=210409 RepID=A0A5B7IRQ3_PORTR|nr:hypothetical protein [Portunus trituberculatus]
MRRKAFNSILSKKNCESGTPLNMRRVLHTRADKALVQRLAVGGARRTDGNTCFNDLLLKKLYVLLKEKKVQDNIYFFLQILKRQNGNKTIFHIVFITLKTK